MRFCRLPWFALLAALLALPAAARAGGGPENVLVVVNRASWASQAVANQFIHLRQIPPDNVLYINWDGDVHSTDVGTFRRKILGPVLLAIQSRGLGDQIDYVAYSSDFPYSIGLGAEMRGEQMPAALTPLVSSTALTYHWQRAMTDSRLLLSRTLMTNRYVRPPHANGSVGDSHAFHSWYGWSANGELLEAGGEQYLLSTVLAVTSGRGNSVTEAARYLKRSASADFKRPAGTFYFCDNRDVRASTRAHRFSAAVQALRKLGLRGEIIPEDLPSNRSDVCGAMLGVARFSWADSGSTILPGAICEHLTSFGAVLREGPTQTPLTELLRHGAAGSSGTVVEPGAVQQKFPLPDMHVHYARGCSLAEAFYQSILAPFQLLVVGDPLCRPWARTAQINVEGAGNGEQLKGQLRLKPTARELKGAAPLDRWELFADGHLADRSSAGGSLSLDTTRLGDGYHELVVVGIESGPIETQSRLRIPVTVNNRGRSVDFRASADKSVRWSQPLTLSAGAAGCDRIVFTHNGRVLRSAAGPKASFSLEPRTLGSGIVRLEATAIWQKDPAGRATSPPIELMIRSAVPLPPPAGETAGRRLRGLQLRLTGGRLVPVQETRAENWLAEAGVKTAESYSLVGCFSADSTDIYQFQVVHDGDVSITVDEQKLYEGRRRNLERHFLPIALAAGVHRLSISGRAGPQVALQLTFGGQGTTSLDGATFRQPAE